MQSAPTIQVYLSNPTTGMPVQIGKDISVAKLQRLAPAIIAKFQGNKKRLILSNVNIDPEGAKVVLNKWVDNYNMSGDIQKEALKLYHLGDDPEFPLLVKVYATCHALGIEKSFRGDEVRDTIHDYIRMAPLRFDEFAMLHEYLPFDTGLLNAAKSETMGQKVNGKSPPPDIKEIEEYAEKMGFLEDMKALEERHKGWKAGRERRAAAEARAAVKAARIAGGQ